MKIQDKAITSCIDEILKIVKFPKKLRDSIILFIKSAISAYSLIPAFAGRAAHDDNKKKGIKRFFRLFCCKFLTCELMQYVMLALFKKSIKEMKKIELIIDWTSIRKFNFFSVSLNIDEGRTLPILFAGYEKGKQDIDSSQPEIEKNTLKQIRAALGEKLNVKVIVLADRGFDAPLTLKYIKSLGFSYVIRVSTGDYMYLKNGKKRKISQKIVLKRGIKSYKKIRYTKKEELETNLYCIWHFSQKEPWLLLSDMDINTYEASVLYSKRMRIEEMFKSFKNEHTGFDIKKVRIRHLDRWIRFLFVSSIMFHIIGLLGYKLRSIRRIEQMFSLSTKPPKNQKYIFSIYTLAAHALTSTVFLLNWTHNSWFIKFNGSSWIPLV